MSIKQIFDLFKEFCKLNTIHLGEFIGLEMHVHTFQIVKNELGVGDR